MTMHIAARVGSISPSVNHIGLARQCCRRADGEVPLRNPSSLLDDRLLNQDGVDLPDIGKKTGVFCNRHLFCSTCSWIVSSEKPALAAHFLPH